MKKQTIILALLLIICLGLHQYLSSKTEVNETNYNFTEGPASIAGKYDVKESPYYKKLDIYNMQSTNSLTILPKFKTIQQHSEYSCGPAAALMVINYLDPSIKVTEEELCKKMGTSIINGTTTKGMMQYFDKDKWQVESSKVSKTPDTDVAFKEFVIEHLKNNTPIIVENVDWGGHWRVIIGYDDLSTSGISDDILIMADPYDITDHAQDGYSIVPAQRFFYMWFDHQLYAKDDQEKQWISVKRK